MQEQWTYQPAVMAADWTGVLSAAAILPAPGTCFGFAGVACNAGYCFGFRVKGEADRLILSLEMPEFGNLWFRSIRVDRAAETGFCWNSASADFCCTVGSYAPRRVTAAAAEPAKRKTPRVTGNIPQAYFRSSRAVLGWRL